MERFQASVFALWAVEGGFGLQKTAWSLEGFRNLAANSIARSGGVEAVETLPELCGS